MKTKLFSLLTVAALLACFFAACAEGTWICPQCSRENPDRANFCGGCRHEKPTGGAVVTAVTNAWVCSSCGSVCSDNDSFCMNCAGDRYPTDERAILADEVTLTAVDPVPAKTEIFEGSFRSENEQYAVRYTAPVTGNYRFWLKEADSGFGVRLEVDDSYGDRLNYAYVYRDDGLTVELEAGRTYTLIVEQYSSTGRYTAALGVPRQRLDLSGAQIVRDSLSFADQTNHYALYAPLSGVYYAWIDSARSGLSFRIDISDSEGYSLNYAYVDRDEGLVFTLQAGKTYDLAVSQYRDTGDYTLKIGMQTPTIDIAGCAVLGDRMYFKEQDNVYRFIAAQSGYTRISIAKAGPDTTVVLTVFDAEGFRITYGYLSQGDYFDAELEAGKTYYLHATQSRGLGEYVVRIGG